MQTSQLIGLSAFTLAGSMALGSTAASCLLNTHGFSTGGTGEEVTASSGSSGGGSGATGPGGGGSGATGGKGGTGGAGGSGGSGGGELIPGAQYVPQPQFPSEASSLPPTRAFLSWKIPSAVPSGKALSGYEICETAGASSGIDGDGECPNGSIVALPRVVIDPIAPDVTTTWKVRTLFQGGDFSAWSPLRTFQSDHSLASWWRMDGGVQDSGAASVDGTLQGGAGFGAGIDGQALKCDGAAGYAEMATAVGVVGALTVSAWVFADGLPVTADAGIAVKGSLHYGLTYHTDGKAYFYIGYGGNNVKASLSPNAWHHVAGSFNGTASPDSLKLYIDGVLAAIGASAVPMTGALGNLWIGRYSNSFFKGLIDNVSIYDAAFSDVALLNEYCGTQAAGGADLLPALCL